MMWCVGSLFLLVWTYSEAMFWRLIQLFLYLCTIFYCVAFLLFGVYYWYHNAFEVLVKYALLFLLQIKKNYIEYCWGSAHDSRNCSTLLAGCGWNSTLIDCLLFYSGSCVKFFWSGLIHCWTVLVSIRAYLLVRLELPSVVMALWAFTYSSK